MNAQTKHIIENIRTGYQCGHYGSDRCLDCISLNKCTAMRMALIGVIKAIKGKEIEK